MSAENRFKKHLFVLCWLFKIDNIKIDFDDYQIK